MVFMRVYFSVSRFDPQNVGITLLQYDLNGQPAEQVKQFENDFHFWTHANWLILWIAQIYYVGYNLNDFKIIFPDFLENLYSIRPLSLALNKNTALLLNKINLDNLQNKIYVDFMINKNRAFKIFAYNIPERNNVFYQLYLYGFAYNFFAESYTGGDNLIKNGISLLIENNKEYPLHKNESFYIAANIATEKVMSEILNLEENGL